MGVNLLNLLTEMADVGDWGRFADFIFLVDFVGSTFLVASGTKTWQ